MARKSPGRPALARPAIEARFSGAMEFIDLKAQYRALGTQIDARMRRVLEHGRYIMGPEVAELEARLAARTGTRRCLTCSSGTDALLIALMALEAGPGDEVIVPAFAFAAPAEMVALLGATPVFVDIQPRTWNVDPAAVEAALTPRTRAIVAIGMFGQPADMDALAALADGAGIALIEDAAQSFGARYRGRASGSLARVGCTSFHPSKPLGCYGDGGALFTSDDALAAAMEEIRDHGQRGRYMHRRIGLNGRMDTLQCAVLLAKLDAFDGEHARRGQAAAAYLEALAGVEGVTLPLVRSDRTSAWAHFTIEVAERDALARRLAAAGVPTAVHYPRPLHLQPAFSGRCRVAGGLAHALAASRRVVSLPMHGYLEPATQASIIEAVVRAMAPA